MATRLKTILRQHHLHNHDLFVLEYDKTARQLEQRTGPPSRAQFHRWLRGDLKRLPHPSHCRVLETMFPEWTVDELFVSAADHEGELVSAARPGGLATSTIRQPESMPVQLQAPSAVELDGSIVDLATVIEIDIEEDGRAIVAYSYRIANKTERPIARIPRAVWFRHVHADLSIEPKQFDPYQSFIQLLHETGNHAKFAYHLSPAIEPGQEAQYGCEIQGGQFLDELYWRHSVLRQTDCLTISVLHRGKSLRSCAATEELLDGSERLITDQIDWRHDSAGLAFILTARGLQPTQSVTVTWEVDE